MKRRTTAIMIRMLSVLFLLTLSGCGACSFWGNEAIWKDLDHIKFSAYGYKHPTAENARQSREDRWWGCEVSVPSASNSPSRSSETK